MCIMALIVCQAFFYHAICVMALTAYAACFISCDMLYGAHCVYHTICVVALIVYGVIRYSAICFIVLIACQAF